MISQELIANALAHGYTDDRPGKVELRLNAQTSSDTAWPQPQPEQLNRLSHVQGTIRGWLPTARELSVNEVLNWCKAGTVTERLDEAALNTWFRAHVADPAEPLVLSQFNRGASNPTFLLVTHHRGEAKRYVQIGRAHV